MSAASHIDVRTTRFFEHIQPESSKASLLYSVLPHLIQRRIEKIPSFRKAVYQYDKARLHRRDPSQSSSSSVAPPPSYRSSASDEFEAICSPLSSRPASPGSATPENMDEATPNSPPTSGTMVPFQMQQSQSGVQYKYVNQGSSLLVQSTLEATSPSEDADLSRSLYVDSVKYLLHGLPRDLTVDEVMTLRAAAAARLGPTPGNGNSLGSSGTYEKQEDEPKGLAAPASLLQVVIAFITMYLFLGITRCWPCIRRRAQKLQRYNHEHGISDKVVAYGVNAADSMIRLAIMLISTVWATKDGNFCTAVRGLASWLIVGVIKGLYDGLGEGMRRKGLHFDPEQTCH